MISENFSAFLVEFENAAPSFEWGLYTNSLDQPIMIRGKEKALHNAPLYCPLQAIAKKQGKTTWVFIPEIVNAADWAETSELRKDILRICGLRKPEKD